MAEKTVGKEAIERKAICGDRFGLVEGWLRYVKQGERRIEDVAKVGPANVEKCTMIAAEWDKIVGARESTGQCKGIFFSTFGQRHMFRRCEVAADDMCSVCTDMREKARKAGLDVVSIEGQEAYEVVNKALFTRAGVVAAMTFWDKQSETIKEEKGVNKSYPFFTAQEVVQLLMMQTGVIFENGGKGGRVYKRSRAVVEAQDRYLHECMTYILTILKKEKKKQFKQRFERLVKIGKVIHDEMLSANVGSDMSEVGAIQTSDVVREELCRAAKWAVKGTRPPKFLSNNVKQLADWAQKRSGAEVSAKSEGEASVHSPSTSPPASVSSSPSSPHQRARAATGARAGAKKPLALRKVGGEEGREEGAEEEDQEEAEEETEVPIFKKFEIRESTIPGAGEGLFLTEAAVHDEAIARYSGELLSEVEAKKLKSAYTVRISADQYLCATRKNDWEGKKANCARKSRRVCNARFASNGVCNFCEKSRKHWIKIFAVGSIDPQDEVLPDYGDEYWPEDDEPPLPTPKSNYRVVSSSDVKEDSDSSWEPPAAKSKSTPKRALSSQKDGGYAKVNTRSRKVFKQKIYAVTVGRCIGMFRSAVRMRSSTFKYPGAGQATSKFTSEEEAREYLIEEGVTDPKCFWKSSYESGKLVQDPDAVIGRDVYFPVGIGVDNEKVEHGVVTASVMSDDSRMWKVTMDDGFVDKMTEWPLLCGLSLSEERSASASSSVEVSEANASEQHEDTGEVFFAIRGTPDDGIVNFITDVFPRLVGEHAEYDSFDSERKAQEWIDEIQFFAVTLPDGSSSVVTKTDIVDATRGRKGVRVKGPCTRQAAAEEVRKWDKQRESKTKGVRVRRAPKPLQDGCIARLKNGNCCGKTHGLSDTLLGPMCKTHAALCKSDESDENEMGQEQYAEGVEVQYTKRQRVKAPIRETSEDRQDVVVSPEVGVKLPEMIESLKKDRKGIHAVVAVRTFPDEDCPKEPAGSVWLSSDKAAGANLHQGEMRIFNTAKDIFENIELAHEWIKGQVLESESTDLEGEADKRWREAQERVKKRKADDKKDGKSGGRNADKKNRGKSHGGRGAGKGNRGKGRGGRGAGKGKRSAGTGGVSKKNRGKGKKASSTRKSVESESDDSSSCEDDDSASSKEDASGPSRGDRRFRKSRRRGSSRGGLRSGAIKMLDKKQKRVENQLFPDDAEEVAIYEFDVPDVKLCQKVPLPGKAQALTTSKDAKHVLSFGNDMKAELAEKTFKSFEAFSLADLMEFQETVEYVASYQPVEKRRVTELVVQAVRVIASNAIHMYSTMRDSDTMGNHGENFKAYTYLQIMYLVMFREAFDSALAELWFVSYAPKFARMARGCAGMAPFKDVREATAATSARPNDRCLVCGKKGHRADSDVHKAEIAEGGLSMSPDKLKSALAYIASDDTLNAEQKRSWSARIKAFYAKMTADSHREDSL